MDSDHFTSAELEAFCRHPDAAGRMRMVRHLAAGCSCCWESVERLGRSGAGTLESPPDPVVLAVERWAELAGAAGEVSPALDRLRPVHRSALLRARDERLGFCRLVIEESRELVATDPSRATQTAREVLALVSSPELAGLDERVYRHLRALAQAHLADAYQTAEDHLAAEQAFRDARSELALGNGEAEIEATVDELEADLAVAQGRYVDALGFLARAEERLGGLRPGERLAEVLVRRGFVLMRLGEVESARDALHRAFSLLEGNKNPRLRLSVLHNLASAEVRAGDFEAARKIMREAEPLYAESGYELIRVQQQWLLGVIATHADEPDDAESLLRRALQGFLDLGYGFDAVRVLIDLGRLCVVAEREWELAELEELFRDLLRGSEFRAFMASELRKLQESAKKKRRSLPRLAETIARLEARKKRGSGRN
ncbi:MAG: tetratricopeptide repeat protein [bacterium]|nr:tetratricopeptide repeat protein [bacterium]